MKAATGGLSYLTVSYPFRSGSPMGPSSAQVAGRPAKAMRIRLAGLRTAAETSAAETQASGKTTPRRTRCRPGTVIRHCDPSRGRPDL